MAEFAGDNLHDVQASNLSYIYKQLGLGELFDRVARLEENAGLEPTANTLEAVLASQPPRTDYVLENEPISVDTTHSVRTEVHSVTLDRQAAELEAAKPVRVEDYGEAVDAPVDEDEEVAEEDEKEEQLALFDVDSTRN